MCASCVRACTWTSRNPVVYPWNSVTCNLGGLYVGNTNVFGRCSAKVWLQNLVTGSVTSDLIRDIYATSPRLKAESIDTHIRE